MKHTSPFSSGSDPFSRKVTIGKSSSRKRLRPPPQRKEILYVEVVSDSLSTNPLPVCAESQGYIHFIAPQVGLQTACWESRPPAVSLENKELLVSPSQGGLWLHLLQPHRVVIFSDAQISNFANVRHVPRIFGYQRVNSSYWDPTRTDHSLNNVVPCPEDSGFRSLALARRSTVSLFFHAGKTCFEPITIENNRGWIEDIPRLTIPDSLEVRGICLSTVNGQGRSIISPDAVFAPQTP